MGPIFANFSHGESARSSVSWIVSVARSLKRSERFLHLSLPFLKNQIILDRLTKKTIRLQIRDKIDYAVIKQIFVNHDYDLRQREDIAATYAKIVSAKKLPLIIDCGANSGMATRYFSETFPESRIIAVEPVADNLEVAKINNPHGNIEFLLAGVGSDRAHAEINDPGGGNWAYRTQLSEDGSVQIITVNDILELHADSVPFLIKIDIEGFENELFSKNTEWVQKFPVLIIELHDWMLPRSCNSKAFLSVISRLNRDFLLQGENVISIANNN